MATEIERKFLVTGELPDGEDTEIVQAYLNLDPKRTTRVRIESGQATVTIKGKTRGISRVEFEYPIPLDDARELVKIALGVPIEKTRRRVRAGEFTWEIDTFHGANAGLVVAEIELQSETDDFQKPAWLGAEVSDQSRYVNARLVEQPFSSW
ncbi:MAG: adenylate cyclase [Verrucomicrobiales bacterium]|jgi:adenylate cyclase